ncbi:hypothetical protein ACN42_g6880 [Penicillium freii]|uniref:Uncharacterized protein n=1 Tax=Penicillium freii TaxID=48697 RepID=A0A101MGR0_PENFR|nr:hypothetical protein ACN42_g6880 [Penicillium freii]
MPLNELTVNDEVALVEELFLTVQFKMGWFSDDSDQAQAYNTYNGQQEHDPSVIHELIAGAASYEAAKAYENHVAENGEPDSHAKAKEILAGFAGAFVDREVETRGLDFFDKEKAKYDAYEQVHDAYDNNENQF